MFLTNEFFNLGRKNPENLSFKSGHFSTISGHFFANFINIFPKTEIQTVILRCLLCLSLCFKEANSKMANSKPANSKTATL
jgi:hypothetical protein